MNFFQTVRRREHLHQNTDRTALSLTCEENWKMQGQKKHRTFILYSKDDSEQIQLSRENTGLLIHFEQGLAVVTLAIYAAADLQLKKAASCCGKYS